MKASEAKQHDLFGQQRPGPEEIISAALEKWQPVARFALFSGGDDSLVTTHWLMNNVDGCEVLHVNTGIGIEATRVFVRETCTQYGWPLTEVHAKEDCGKDYEEWVLKHGFPGPFGHRYMYANLKERAIEHVVRQRKTKRMDKVLLATGVRHDESDRRSGYAGGEVRTKGAQLWANPFYWVGASDFHHYRASHQLRRNPVSEVLGMSGECLCGAYAKPGELAAVRLVAPQTAAYLEDLQDRVRAAGHGWGWEYEPPRGNPPPNMDDLFSPLCVGCMKAARAK